MSDIIGIFNILATPFKEDYSLDVESLRRLVRFQMSLGVQGLTILGVLGEAAKLTVPERKQVMDTVMETVNGQIPVVVGTSHPELETCIQLSREAQAAGAAGVMIAPPPMPGATDDDLVNYYAKIAESCGDLAIVAQDYPKVNDIIMSPDMLAQLADTVDTVRQLKLEDPPLMQKVTAIRQRTDKLTIFGGLGGMFLLEELARGTDGTMTGFAFSEILVAIYEAYSSGERERATLIFDKYLPLIRYENQPEINLPIRKELLRRRGAIDCSTPREPFKPLDEGTHTEIEWMLQRVGIDDPTRTVSIMS